ncbi:pentapeptide repeat-containing protein [Nocardiopsis sp. RSe5-2]|uniref:Pentapeptide repeat-containing protein n=1 Tax=Nocardiopsis endophytica TaxID=3018445 RepID=A0ABT4UBP4_9ACTN|nr:pentapeptide repeat-containing protein [Nocardiopsis endophytica]MDA2814391.1 pentapeptide repeat-containing protein [Nocardiopsis endophytica]
MRMVFSWPHTERVRNGARVPVRSWFVVVGTVVAVLAALWGILFPLTDWAADDSLTGLSGRDRADVIDATRRTLLQAAGGTAALTALLFTVRTYLLNRRGQQTQRFKDAVEQLGSEQTAVRIGGIYSLEHIMRESPEDHRTVVEVLSAFVRETSPAPDTPQEPRKRLGTDVQAALTVLGRRPPREETAPLDLHATDLRGADLTNARLHRANLSAALLGGANLSGARLEAARMRGADLNAARLRSAHLEGADLAHARMDGADLLNARLPYARLWGASLPEADLGGSDLEGAYLKEARLEGANLYAANLRRATLAGARIDRADLRRADLASVDGLLEEQVASAVVDG